MTTNELVELFDLLTKYGRLNYELGAIMIGHETMELRDHVRMTAGSGKGEVH